MIIETSDSITLFFETFGDEANDPVLLIHGLGADHQMWQPQLVRYPNEGHFVVAPDMRGHGESSTPIAFSLQDCARDMSELLDGLALPQASVVGVSMGGLIAQQFACDYPEKVDKLVIVDSFSGVTSIAERFNAWLASFLLAVLPTSLQTKLLAATYSKMGKPEVASYFEAQAARIDPAMLRQARSTVNKFDIFDRLHEIQAPTLVLVGDGFGQTAINMAQKTAGAIQGSSFKILEGGGDPSNMLVAEAFDREVLAFVK
jgi:3-oxoadipate enol-lactonase